MADENIRVSVDSGIHQTINAIAQNIYDQYGISISDIHIDWVDVSQLGKKAMLISGVTITSKTRD